MFIKPTEWEGGEDKPTPTLPPYSMLATNTWPWTKSTLHTHPQKDTRKLTIDYKPSGPTLDMELSNLVLTHPSPNLLYLTYLTIILLGIIPINHNNKIMTFIHVKLLI